METCNIHTEAHIEIADNVLDKNRCRELINLVFSRDQQIARKDREMIPDDCLTEELGGSNREVYMLFYKQTGDLIGTGVLILHQGDLADICYLAVDPKWRGLGFGKKIMQFAESRARMFHKKTRICLTVAYHPKYPLKGLISWYEDQGYVFLLDGRAAEEQMHKWFDDRYRENVYFKCFEKRFMSKV